jgi:hypothetical protein
MPMNFGQVLVTGGSEQGGGNGRHLAESERYDSSLDRWFPLAPLAVARYRPVIAAIGGSIFLVIGGVLASPDPSAERYDVISAAWLPIAGLGTPRTGYSATPLPYPRSGQVLVAGGRATGGTLLATTELYTDIAPPYTPPTGPRPGVATPGTTPTIR